MASSLLDFMEVPADPVEAARVAVEALRLARDCLKSAGAPRAHSRTRAALSSAEGRCAPPRTARHANGAASMVETLKVYSVVIAWCDGDPDQGDWGTYVRARDEGEAKALARLAMRAEYIANEVPAGDNPDDWCSQHEGKDGFGGRVISCDEGAAWLSPRLEAALRAIRARVDGEFDHPDLLVLGPLGTIADDIRRLVDPILAEIDAVDGADAIHASAAAAAGWEQGGDGPVWWHTSHGSWKNAASWGRTYATAREVIQSEDYPEYQGREDEQ